MKETELGVFNTISDGPVAMTLIYADKEFYVRMRRLDGTFEVMSLEKVLTQLIGQMS